LSVQNKKKKQLDIQIHQLGSSEIAFEHKSIIDMVVINGCGNIIRLYAPRYLHRFKLHCEKKKNLRQCGINMASGTATIGDGTQIPEFSLSRTYNNLS